MARRELFVTHAVRQNALMKRRRRSWLRRAAWLAVGGLLLLGSLYVYLTRPARLRSQVLEALAALPTVRADVGRVTFSLRGGLEVRDLVLTMPPGDVATPTTSGAADQPWLRVARARVRCALPALLRGDFQPREVVLSDGELTLVGSRAAHAIQSTLNGLGRRGRTSKPGGETVSALPRIRLERADLRLLAGQADELRLVRRTPVRGTGMPTDTGYELRIEPLGGGEAPLAVLHWDRARGEMHVALDWVDLHTVMLFLPASATQACQELNLQGRVRLERAVLRGSSGDSTDAIAGRTAPAVSLHAAELRLADVHCSVPVEEVAGEVAAQEQYLPPAQRFLQIEAAGGGVGYRQTAEGETLTVHGSGRLNGAPAEFELTAQPAAYEDLSSAWDHVMAVGLRVDGLTLPAAEEHPAFVNSRRLPAAVRKFFREYQPSGPVNLRLRARRTSAQPGPMSIGGLAVEGEVEAVGAACWYYRFPYGFTDIRGRLRISPAGVFFDGLYGRHGSARARIDGIVHHARRATSFDLAVHGENIPLDHDLFAAVPAKYRHLWEQTLPLGVCDANVTLHREEGSPDDVEMPPTAVHIDARLLGGSLQVEPGKRLRAVEGLLTIADGAVRLHDLHGYLDGAAVRLAGTIGADSDGELADLRVEAADVHVERGATLDAGADGFGAEVRFAGRADVWGHLRGAGAPGERTVHYAVHIKDGVLTGFDSAAPWDQCQGWISANGPQQEAIWFTARQAGARLSARGTLPTASRVDTPISLEINVADVVLDHLAQQVVPPRWGQAVAALGLSGPGAVALQLRPEESTAEPGRQAAEIHVTAERMTPAPLPVELRDVRARVALTADGLELRGARGRQGEEGRVTASGRVEWQGGTPSAEFGLSARQVEITPDLIDAMPEGFSRLLRRLAPKGRIHAELDRVSVAGHDDRTWQFDGRLVLEAAELFLGLPLTAFNGQLRGTCTVRPDGETDVSAEFTIRAGRLGGRPIEDWEGRLERRHGARWVRLEDLRGRLCDGDALGFVNIDPATSDFELSLTLQDVSLGQLLPPKQAAGNSRRRGRVDGRVFLRGTAGDVASRRGGGDLRIRGASFLQTPVLATVAQASRRGEATISDALDLAELRFVWHGSELKFTRVDIQSRDLRLVGDGTWDMETDAIVLTLVGAHPDHWPRIAVLTDLLEIAGQELLQYHVRGTAASPQVTVEPLHKLNATLRALLLDDN